MTTQIETLERDVSRHEAQIQDIFDQLNGLSKSHAELGFILKTYMEKFAVFEKKIDGLGEKLELLMPNKKQWEMERQVEDLQREARRLYKYIVWLGISNAALLLAVALFNPDAAKFIIGLF